MNDLKLVVFKNAYDLGVNVEREIQTIRNCNDPLIVSLDEIVFSNGEGKIVLNSSIRGKDVFILSDVCNYSETYKMHGMDVNMSPVEHFNNIKRAISAMRKLASSITVVEPFLYAGRQHRRKKRESTDCADALKELENLGVNAILTFDAHDPDIQNAVSIDFMNAYPTATILTYFVKKERDLNYSNLICVAPDEGAFERTRLYADLLTCNMGACIKRRDVTKVIDGRNPIAYHEYIGPDVKNKQGIIVDDMISSGESILEAAQDLKKRGIDKIYFIATFSLFVNGINKFQEKYEEGIFEKLYTTNLSYIPNEYRNLPWLELVDCTKQLSELIDMLNKQQSISESLSQKEPVLKLIKK